MCVYVWGGGGGGEGAGEGGEGAGGGTKDPLNKVILTYNETFILYSTIHIPHIVQL